MSREKSDITTSEERNNESIRTLGRLVRQKRIAERLTLERAAEQSLVSSATLSRLERQADIKTANPKTFIVPDTRTITALVSWIGVSHDDIMKGGLPQERPIVPKLVEGKIEVEGEIIPQDTPQIVKAYLRADPNLSSQAAANLAEMFQLIYWQYAQMSKPEATNETSSNGGDNQSSPEE